MGAINAAIAPSSGLIQQLLYRNKEAGYTYRHPLIMHNFKHNK